MNKSELVEAVAKKADITKAAAQEALEAVIESISKALKKGDEVIVIAGKDKGKRGTVLSVAEERVTVGGINLVKKHVKPNPMKGEQGGVLSKEMPINISNVSLFNPISQKADRVGFKTLDDGRKVRIFKSSGEIIVKA